MQTGHDWPAFNVRDFKGGITAGVMPSITRITYDQPLAAFGATREDIQLSGQISLLNRRLYFPGLTPKIGYTYAKNDCRFIRFVEANLSSPSPAAFERKRLRAIAARASGQRQRAPMT